MNIFIPGQDALRRLVQSKIRAEWQALGRTLPPHLDHGNWPLDLRLDEDDLGADSLDRMALASAVSQLCCLSDAGNEDRLLVERTFGGWIEVVEEAWAHRLERLTFLTSGSTNVAKRCQHAYPTLMQEARFFAGLHTGRRRVVALVPAHHIYGFLFTILLPEILGVPVLDLSRSGSLAQLAPGDLVIGFPTRWQAVLRSGMSFAEDVQATTSTAPCHPSIIHGLSMAGLAQMIEIYGSSETGGVGWRNSTRDTYRLLPCWQRVDEKTLCAETGHGLMTHALNDYLVWADERSFHVGTRLDCAVQVGGLNVFPDAIARRLEQHPAIANAAVRFNDADQRLNAFLVPKDAAACPNKLVLEIEAWITKVFKTHERPRHLTVGPAVPASELGKSISW